MRFLYKGKDGGPTSPVTGFFVIEIKWLFSIVFLRFGGNREVYHSHAFNAFSWFLNGSVVEYISDGTKRVWRPSIFPKFTPRDSIHRVEVKSPVYAFTIRGPWRKYWIEEDLSGKVTVLTHGRKVVKKL